MPEGSSVGPADIEPSAEVIDVGPVEEVLVPDEVDDTDAIDPEDFAPAPEFSGFEVWCDYFSEWASEWRPSSEEPWYCKLCGRHDHERRDHEGAGA